MRAKDPPKSRREEYSEATRQALLDAGREAFAAHGYQAAGMEAISRAARVTRGAFYHHFEDKKALFDAVVVAMQREAAAKIEAAARASARSGIVSAPALTLISTPAKSRTMRAS